MTPNPKISVIICCYKQAQYLKKAIDCVLNQTYKNFEIIVVDDASPDNVGEVVQEYRSLPNFRYIRLNENKGLGIARNVGVSASTGQWIVPLDSDDTIDVTYLEKTINKAKDENTVVYTKTATVQLSNNRVEHTNWIRDNVTLKEQIEANAFPVTCLFSKSAFNRVGGYIIEREHMQVTDWDIWINLMSHGCKFVFLPEHLYFHSFHNSNMTTATTNAGLWDKHKQFLQKKYKDVA